MKEPKQTNKPITLDSNAKVTPITQQEIHQVQASAWSKTSLTELYDQLTTLRNRRMVAIQMGKPEMVEQIDRGINQIQAVISAKQSDQGTLS